MEVKALGIGIGWGWQLMLLVRSPFPEHGKLVNRYSQASGTFLHL